MTTKIAKSSSIMSKPNKLKILRKLMRQENVDAFLIPRADCYQGEFISASDARLAWLTGFTGSAGLCIVSIKDVALFVDGRYSIQAEKEKNNKDIQILRFEQKVIIEWFKLNLKSSNVIGFDPWLHTIKEIETFKKELQGFNKIKPCINFIDKLWKNRPKEKFGKIYRLIDKYSGENYKIKLKNVDKMMMDSKVDFLIHTLPDSICWLLNIRGQDIPNTPIVKAFAIQNRGSEVEVFLESSNTSNPILEKIEPKICFSPIKSLIPRLKSLKGKIWLNNKSCPLAIKELLSSKKTILYEDEDPCSNLKAIKNPVEIKGVRSAHRKDGLAMIKFLYWLSKNTNKDLDEILIIKFLEEFRQQGEGYQGPSFDTICGSGPNGAIIHYRANNQTNRILSKGDMILIDSGGQYFEGTTDITRTIPIGRIQKIKKKHFTLVLKGMITISKLKWPIGLSGRDIDCLARYHLWQEGLDYDHGTGHGVGCFLSVHEGPQAISRRNEVELKPGMIISNEPGFYVPGFYGIRIENLLLVKEVRHNSYQIKKPMLNFETLTFCPIDKKLLLPELLTKDELKWLNNYHRQVKIKFKDKLEPRLNQWLSDICSPIYP